MRDAAGVDRSPYDPYCEEFCKNDVGAFALVRHPDGEPPIWRFRNLEVTIEEPHQDGMTMQVFKKIVSDHPALMKYSMSEIMSNKRNPAAQPMSYDVPYDPPRVFDQIIGTLILVLPFLLAVYLVEKLL